MNKSTWNGKCPTWAQFLSEGVDIRQQASEKDIETLKSAKSEIDNLTNKLKSAVGESNYNSEQEPGSDYYYASKLLNACLTAQKYANQDENFVPNEQPQQQ